MLGQMLSTFLCCFWSSPTADKDPHGNFPHGGFQRAEHSQPRTVFQIFRKFSEMKHVSPSILGKQVDVREVESHLPPVEIHLPEQNHQEALEDVAADGEYINTLGLSVIWSICWAKSLRLGEEEEKELESKKKPKC